jgi:AcrR family transcriptional regulator
MTVRKARPSGGSRVSSARGRKHVSTKKHRRQRLRKAERFEQLIATARSVFASHGFHGTTTKMIAHAARVNEAVIFQHFRSKVALYAAVLDDANRRVWVDLDWLKDLEELQHAGDDEGFVRLLFARLIGQCERHPYYPRLALYSALEPTPAARQVQNSAFPQISAVIRRFIIAGQEAGRFGSGSVGLLHRSLLALPYYSILQDQLFQNPPQKCEPGEVLEYSVAFALAGLARGSFNNAAIARFA